jgi:hypothetical protein
MPDTATMHFGKICTTGFTETVVRFFEEFYVSNTGILNSKPVFSILQAKALNRGLQHLNFF